MTNAALPPGIDPDDEISVTWETQEDGSTIVTSQLGGASIVVRTTEESAHLVPWLVAATPNILEAAWHEVEKQQEEA